MHQTCDDERLRGNVPQVLDEAAILEAASRTGRLVIVAENHSRVGAPSTLHDRYGISAEAMARSVRGWLSRSDAA